MRIWGKQLNIPLTEEFIYAVWNLTQGYPFAIESLMTSASPATQNYPDPKALDEVVSFELTHWYVFQRGFFEPAKELLETLGIYYTDLAQFNELAKAFGYLGFPEKGRKRTI